jgi:acetyl-CoA carboxylase carboxyl transferase subunit alpha
MFFLDFEDKLENLNTEKEILIKSSKVKNIDISSKIKTIESKELKELEKIYKNLSPWQIVKIARHPKRPKTLDYIHNLFTDFTYLSGDRLYSEDKSIVSGIGKIGDCSFMILGNEKGHDMETRIDYNFGMAKPEGYRKSQRIMKLAEKFQLPLICFIDTSGAYPGKDAEERGQAEAIARSMQISLNIQTPCISIIIGEGGSGGAIALGASDRVLMLSNSIYSVISPEGCSSILWKSSDFSEVAANSLKITAKDCLNLKIIDEIIEEPIGGAHRNSHILFDKIKNSILNNFQSLKLSKINDLKILRNKRYLDYFI